MLQIKGKPHLWARCDKHGWLWKRTGRQGSWTRHWVVVKGSVLVVFPDEKVLAFFWKMPVVFAPRSLFTRTEHSVVMLTRNMFRSMSLQKRSGCTQAPV